MKKMFQLLMVFLIGVTLSCSSSSQQKAASKNEKRIVTPTQQIQVVATTGMVADAVKNVGGEYVQVVQLMGAGVDPHLYKASQGDIAKLENAVNNPIAEPRNSSGIMSEIHAFVTPSVEAA